MAAQSARHRLVLNGSFKPRHRRERQYLKPQKPWGLSQDFPSGVTSSKLRFTPVVYVAALCAVLVFIMVDVISYESFSHSAENVNYDSAHANGVIILVVAGFLSGLAVLSVFMGMMLSPSALSKTHFMPYLVSLLGANLLQAVGVIMNMEWVIEHAVEENAICTVQGFIKQAGNVGTAVWSLVIAICVFRLMFLRTPSSLLVNYLILMFGWLVIAFVVAIGPLAIQSPAKGAYFGPSGYWCWITDAYPMEQTFLEYFWEFMSAGISLILYAGILLRVRGNLVHSSDGWHVRFVPSSERWQLAINRDWVDSSMMGFAAVLLWYPVTYVLLLVPISIARFIDFSGKTIPFTAVIITDTLFNLQGLANAILLFSTRRLAPDATALVAPAPRKVLDMTSSSAVGITPFMLTSPQNDDSARRTSRTPSLASVSSQTPLNPAASNMI